ncbi:MAG: acetylglutamate kinase, partial [Terriglobia bacterium]
LGKEVKFHNGLRVTDKETMEIVRMVLVGKVNKELVSLINHQGGPDPGLDSLAVGVSGDDGGLILAEKMTAPDIGFVGKVKRIEPTILNNLINDGFTPVVASIGSGEDGESYNINADQVAAAVAVALKADKMIFLSDVPGLYRDFADRGSLISVIDSAAGRKMVEDGGASEGMIPKIKACAEVVEAGIKRAHILDGTQPHALLLEIFTDEGIGTMFTPANLGEAG